MSPRAALGIAALIATVMIAAVWGRAVHEARHYADLGDLAVAEERVEDAIFHYRHSAQWFSPAGHTAQRSVDELIALGDAASDAGERERSLVAWRSARIAVISTRSLFYPNDDRLLALHARIARGMASQRLERAPEDTEAEARYLAQLNTWQERQPDRWVGAFASLAFLGWLLSLAGFAWSALDAEGTLRMRAAAAWGGGVVLFFIAWLIGLRWA
ncbi:MAG: hypothetical protein ACJA1R_002966 [Flavobacteriales bacterium]|jgi:hypothetical protein